MGRIASVKIIFFKNCATPDEIKKERSKSILVLIDLNINAKITIEKNEEE